MSHSHGGWTGHATTCMMSSHLEKGKEEKRRPNATVAAPPPSVVTTAIRSFLCSSSSPDASTSCDRTTPPAACTSLTSWTASEPHSRDGHGAQIHRWSNVRRTHGLRKHLRWEKVASLHFIHWLCQPWRLWHFQPAIFNGLYCQTNIVWMGTGSCMSGACNLGSPLTTLL